MGALLDTTSTLLNALNGVQLFLSTDTNKNDFQGFIFKPNTDLRKIVDILSVGIQQDNIISIESLNESSKQLIQAIENVNDSVLLGMIDSIGLGLSQQLVQSIINIQETVQNEVINLEQMIHDKYIKYIKEEGAEELLDGSTEPDTSKYIIFNWNRINSPSKVKELVTELNNYAKLRSDVYNQSNLQYIVNTIFKDIQKEGKVLNIDDNILEYIISSSVEFLKNYDTLTSEDIENFVKIVVNKQNIFKFFNQIKVKFNQKQDLANNVVSLLTLSNKLEDFLNIKNMNLDISDLEKLQINIDLLDLVQKSIKYYCILIKNTTFKDKVVLNEIYINGPELNKLEQQGKTLVDIVNFIRAVYDNKVPNFGISTKLILTKNIDSFLEKYKKNIQVKANYIKSKSLNRAFVNVMRKYYDNIAILMNIDEDSEDYKKNKVKWYNYINVKSNRLTGDITKLNDVLYDTLINFLYPDSLTSQIFNRLQKSYENLLNNDETDVITDENILRTELEVVADLMVEYLMKNYCDFGKV